MRRGFSGLSESMRALVHAGDQLGIPIRIGTHPSKVVIGGQTFQVRFLDRVNDIMAHGLVANARRDELIAARRITDDARTILRHGSIAFFDARGALSIRRDGLIVETAFEPLTPAARQSRRALSGIGLDVAMWLLHDPVVTGVRPIARQIGRTASSVSDALARLVDEGLVTSDHEPMLPDLFELVTQEWLSRSNATVVMGGRAQDVAPRLPGSRLDDPSGSGWAWDGRSALVAWGVPGHWSFDSTSIDGDDGGSGEGFLVPGANLQFDIAAHELSVAESDSRGRAGITPSYRLRRNPVEWLSSHRVERGGLVVVPAIVVALDLASDAARGRELLERWRPDGVNVVWSDDHAVRGRRIRRCALR